MYMMGKKRRKKKKGNRKGSMNKYPVQSLDLQ
jgi:hypothetical protein